MLTKKTARALAGALAITLTFAAGWVGGRQDFETRINHGRLNALDSVGENLFGEAVFSAHSIPPNPARDMPESVQIDVAEDSMIPVRLNVFYPPGPVSPQAGCMSYFQVEVSDHGVRLFADPEVFSEKFTGEIIPKSLADYPPGPIRCEGTGAIPGGQ